MSGTLSTNFQDHYKVLGIAPDADSGTVQDAYSKLAALYHVSNKETADKAKFDAVTMAYEVLSNPRDRKDFDEIRTGPAKESAPRFQPDEFFKMLKVEMLRRKTLLCLLYDRRRQNPLRPSLSVRDIESLVISSPEEILFSVWYLKQKGYAVSDDKSNTQIAMPGMDYLDLNPPDRDEILTMLKRHDEPAPPAAKPAPEQADSIPPQAPSATSAVTEASARPTDPVPAIAMRQTLNLPRRTIVIPPRTG